jgi:putative drug exporter of the RND superfamily
MRQSQSSVLPETRPVDHPEPRPVVERIAGWSARHRKTAVFGWLALVAVLFAAAQALGGKNLPSYDPGQAGRAERMLHDAAPDYYGSAPEEVLIRARAPHDTFARDASLRQAVRQVVTALAALPKDAARIQSPITAGARRSSSRSLVSADGRSVLVTFVVPGSTSNQDQAVAADQHAVAAVQARHADLPTAVSSRPRRPTRHRGSGPASPSAPRA